MADKYIYIDQNVIGDVSDGNCTLPVSEEFDWVYSAEHFNEIRRGEDLRFLSALQKLKARRIWLVLNDKFQITGNANIDPYDDPCRLYERYIKTVDEIPFDEGIFTRPLARMLGTDNYDALASLPHDIEGELMDILGSAGLLSPEYSERIEQAVQASTTLVSEHLKDRIILEIARKTLGTHGGRAGNLADKDNPLMYLWQLVEKHVGGITADQFYGFDPLDKQGYEAWPFYLGIIGCYTVLNFVGLRPDDGLGKENRIPAIMSDAAHVAHAAYCHALLSGDRRLCAKAKAIYEYKNIGTSVLLLTEKNERGKIDMMSSQ